MSTILFRRYIQSKDNFSGVNDTFLLFKYDDNYYNRFLNNWYLGTTLIRKGQITFLKLENTDITNNLDKLLTILLTEERKMANNLLIFNEFYKNPLGLAELYKKIEECLIDIYFY